MGAVILVFPNQFKAMHWAESFEACCQWTLLIVQIIKPTNHIYCTRNWDTHQEVQVLLSFCNYMNENLEILKVQVNRPLPTTKRGGTKPEYSEKTPDHQSKNQYHISEMKIHWHNRESNPHPLTLAIYLLGQNAPALTSELLATIYVIY